MGKEQNNEYYNEVFKASNIYHNNWSEMDAWTVIWEKSLPILIDNEVKSILDIGSGMGQFGQLCSQNNIQYKGIDFSEYAIHHSIKNKDRLELFVCVDAFQYSYGDKVDCYTSHEFLEHIEEDIKILSKLQSDKLIIFSVPSFDDPGHVRCFKSTEEIIERYSPYIKNLQVQQITNRVHYLGWGYTR